MIFKRNWSVWVLPAALTISVSAGCAHQQSGEKAAEQAGQLELVQTRLEEVEHTNGRLNVRIEELEDQVFLLQDIAESNRIALQRRGYMQRGGYLSGQDAQARAPEPAPESYSGSPSPYDQQEQRASESKRRPVTRIELQKQKAAAEEDSAYDGDEAENNADDASEEELGDELVITDAQFRAFAGEPPLTTSAPRSTSNNKGSGSAQAPVTEEKLATSSQLKKSETPKSGSKPAASSDNPLSIYKAALSQYRRGNYSEALSGFKTFLDSDPDPNYIDNGLYWIGECLYGLGEYQEANTYFTRVLREQPDGNKVPDAMLKMSLSYERMGQLQRTREWLVKLTEQFPRTNAGQLGAQKLANLPEEAARN